MNTTSPPKTSLVKLGLCSKVRSLRVLVLGQSGVGKTALVVRFVTSRFIGEYESNLEKVYTTNTVFDKEAVQFDILDAANRLDQQVFPTFAQFRSFCDTLLLSMCNSFCV